MPKCNYCETTLSSAQMRRSPKGGHICRDKVGCRHDKKLRAKGQEPGPRSLQALLRF
jgi:hypothetical protein